MKGFLKRRNRGLGLIPGSLVHVGEIKQDKTIINIIDYSLEDFQEKELKDCKEIISFKETQTVTWINVDGVHDTDVIQKIGKGYNLHRLVLEDIVNTTQRPKYEDYKDYIFIVLKMLYYDENKQGLEVEQVSIILGDNYVISFQEKQGDVFEGVRERIRHNKGLIRKESADYLAYSLIDAIVDNYFLVLEEISDKTESIEKDLLKKTDPETLYIIQDLKKEIIFLRKSVWPLREVVTRLERIDSPLIGKDTGLFFRDVYDHTIQIIENIESLRDVVSGMVELHLSVVNNGMNEVMKTLTIIATIFIPLTFIAGIYGMNFNPEISKYNMPELNWAYGYIMVLGIMMVMTLFMVGYFKKKKWL